APASRRRRIHLARPMRRSRTGRGDGQSGGPPVRRLTRHTARELVQVAVRGADVDPLPLAVVFRGTDDLDPGSLELAARRVDVVDFEERHRPARVLAEELVVAVSGSKDLDRVTLGGLELDRRRLFEVHPQPEYLAEE